MNPLLQYVHQKNGPVSSVVSTLQPGIFKPFYWRSTARLTDDYCGIFGSRFVTPLLASSWHHHKLISQENAILSALILWAKYQYRDTGEIIGHEINASNTGFAMAYALSEEDVYKAAKMHAICDFAKQQILNNHQFTLRLASLPLLSCARFLYPFGRGQLTLLYTPIDTLDGVFYFAISIFQYKTGECILGSACHETLDKAIDSAIVEGYARYHFIQRVYEGDEQLLDQISLHRQWFFATDASSGNKAVSLLLNRINSESRWELSHPPLFSKKIPGPWGNNLILYRVLYTRSSDESDSLYELPL